MAAEASTYNYYYLLSGLMVTFIATVAIIMITKRIITKKVSSMFASYHTC